jgi:hypothetical protein
MSFLIIQSLLFIKICLVVWLPYVLTTKYIFNKQELYIQAVLHCYSSEEYRLFLTKD